MKDYSSYVALIVATETEEKAIKSMYDWKPVTFSDDTQTYYSASIEKNGSSHKIVYARQSEMGMTVAVTLTMKLIEHFRPQFMIPVFPFLLFQWCVQCLCQQVVDILCRRFPFQTFIAALGKDTDECAPLIIPNLNLIGVLPHLAYLPESRSVLPLPKRYNCHPAHTRE